MNFVQKNERKNTAQSNGFFRFYLRQLEDYNLWKVSFSLAQYPTILL